MSSFKLTDTGIVLPDDFDLEAGSAGGHDGGVDVDEERMLVQKTQEVIDRNILSNRILFDSMDNEPFGSAARVGSSDLLYIKRRVDEILHGRIVFDANGIQLPLSPALIDAVRTLVVKWTFIATATSWERTACS